MKTSDLEKRRDLKRLLLKQQGVSLCDVPGIQRRANQDDYPLSYAQQRLWFLDRFDASTAAYHISLAMRLDGPLDLVSLSRAFQEITRRHEVLRSSFMPFEGQVMQLIAEPSREQLPVVDLSALPADTRQRARRLIVAELAQVTFDLSQGPLVKAMVLKLAAEQHVLSLSMHHIVSDGWSADILMRELTTLYDAYAAGKSSPLPELAIQYADFAQWQREWLSGETLEKQLDYWRRQLAGAPLLPQLPTDRVRPAVQTFRGARVHAEWSPELNAQLKRLAQREGVTLFMTLLAAFQLLLSRWSGQDEVVVGAPIAGRTQLETEPLIGFFVNTLVLRTRVSGNASVRDLLRRVRQVCLGAYTHQDVPFETLVEELQPERNLSHSPLFQVMFAQQDLSLGSLRLNDIEIEAIENETSTAKFDLTLFVSESKQGLVGTIEYNTDLFDASTIRRLLQHYTHLLDAFATGNTEELLSSVNMLSAAEQQQILHDWNQTDSDVPQGRALHQWFELQAQRTPDAVALVFGDREIRYAELNERASGLAHGRRGLGVTNEVRVGVMLERSPLMLMGLLAVLKAGGAYVPLDPNYPQQRVSFMLADAKIQVLLTESQFAERVSDGTVGVIRLDDIEAELAKESTANPNVVVQTENLAYVIYTSGSTGLPKGVAVTHRSASAFIQWAIDFFTAEILQAVLASTSINFDLSVFELFAPLSVGGSVILAENALQLATVAARSRVELINMVPSALAELIRQRAVPSFVRVINLAGEPLPRKLVQEIYALGTVEQVINLYGRSEEHTSELQSP